MKIREEREDKQLDLDFETDSEKNLKARHFRYWRMDGHFLRADQHWFDFLH
ncbi:MAG: hypothetical protein OXC92_06880 [Flavobacteriaceae bacterium]|nr:hypothetical protein [Flavobacteriaceae bacterium]MCY4216688.1 hypothetical protein [Flavobacteriaceae bacterium]